MKSFKNFAYFLFILLFLSCSSQITDATKTDFSVSIDFSSIIESQKQNISRSVTNQNGSIKFKLYDVTNLQLSQDAKFEDVENFFQQGNIEPLFQEETVIVNQKAQVQFKEVDVGVKALILVECAINNADDSIFYNGKSNIFEIKAGENPVTITLSKVVVADPDPEPDPEPEPEPEQQVTLTFIVDGVETNLQGTPGESLTKDSPEKQGYTFVGWEPELPSTFPNSNETYTAKWVEDGQVTSVIFSTDEGPVSINTEISLSCNTQGAQIYYTTDSTKTNYDDSWTQYTEPIIIDSHSVTIKAIAIAEGKQASPITTKTYSLFTYSINPIGCELPEELGFGTYYDGDNVDLTKKEPSKEGYNFEGWSLTQNGEVIYDLTFSQALNPINGFVNLYAIWKKIINFNISYPEYQEHGVEIDHQKNDNTIIFTPKNPENGYSYEWYLDGSKQSSEPSYTFTPDTAGVYCIMLITTINDVPYSSTVTVDVIM